MGLIVCPWIETYGVPQWPTREMVGRGELRSLWVGVLVAVPSGAGVALSVLGGNAGRCCHSTERECHIQYYNSGSLVGVAISASLLPPAVNAGFFWCLSMLIAISQGSIRMYGQVVTIPGNDTIIYSEYEHQYTDNQALEAFILGVISLALTFLNIICIIITGIAILRLKEVTPDKIPQTFSEFWKTDVKSRRGKYNRLEDEEAALLEEGEEYGLDGTIIQGLFEEAQNDDDMKQIQRWVIATQNRRKLRKPYSYTVIADDKLREGPGYRINKTTLLRQQQMQKLKESNN